VAAELILLAEFYRTKRVFDSVVVVAFQIVFRAEIHANDIFFIF
jgi:hypothetical protein